ncbi:TRAP transporter small permease [Mangrovicoccus algicola]|uniref:TRAP transporter small permease protein n=1 Tax=Mangrovicoccus algicola TaxID=2771008 RepID=A0A8J6YZL6_9RHOB|nr:TRAP transporter small permease [Mangrovicoccus algicola]MBE3638783.1 TRAP transporter small permease [Mangrovicoccus algicola]
MDRLDRLLWRCVDFAILLAVLGMVCLITLQVGSRLFGASVPWTEELSRFLFIWTVWFGMAASFRMKTHPSLDILPALATGRLHRILRVVPVLATILLFSAVSYHGYRLVRQQMLFGETSPILGVGMYWATLPLVIGSALSIIAALADALRGDPVSGVPRPPATEHERPAP